LIDDGDDVREAEMSGKQNKTTTTLPTDEVE